MGCNHLAHFLLTLSLLPSLERGSKHGRLGARIVKWVALCAHTRCIQGGKQGMLVAGG